ncbi:hypothetical protein Tco_0522067 [Tanacetum coccineum]
MGDVDINILTMEQYFALTQGNQVPGVVNPENRNNVNFKINGQFMRESRENTFFGTRVMMLMNTWRECLTLLVLFSILSVSHDAIVLRVFSIILIGVAKRCIDMRPSGSINTWDLLEKAFIQSLDKGPIPGMIPTQALESIQNIVDHSQKWHDGSSNRRTSSGNSDGVAAITSKLDSLGHDMKKIKETVHAIQFGYGICGGMHLDKECQLNKKFKGAKEVKYDEFGRYQPRGAEEVLKWMNLELPRGDYTLVSLFESRNRALGQHSEEIHLTWAHFGKKRDEIATLHEEAQKLHTVRGDDVRISSDSVRICKRRRQNFGDGVRT